MFSILNVPKLHQVQNSLNEQLSGLTFTADHLGLKAGYDYLHPLIKDSYCADLRSSLIKERCDALERDVASIWPEYHPLVDDLRTLRAVAVRLGFYDAADFVRDILERSDAR